MELAGSYQEYLKSDLWREQRARVMRRDRNKCQCCGGPATQVHHIGYTKRMLRGQGTYFLIAVCRPCHEFLEFDDGQKVNIKAAKYRILKLRRQHGLTTSTSKLLQTYGVPGGRKKRKEAHQRYIERNRRLKAHSKGQPGTASPPTGQPQAASK